MKKKQQFEKEKEQKLLKIRGMFLDDYIKQSKNINRNDFIEVCKRYHIKPEELSQLSYVKQAREKEKQEIEKKNHDKNLLKDKLEEMMKNPASLKQQFSKKMENLGEENHQEADLLLNAIEDLDDIMI